MDPNRAAANTSAVLRAQHGVISRGQARDAGLTDRQITGRVQRGSWNRLLPGVFVSANAVCTWHAWAHAFVLAAGPDTSVIGPSAATLRRLSEPTFPIMLAVPVGRRPRLRHSKVRVLRTEVPPSDIVVVDGLPTTTRIRTAIDLAHLLSPIVAQPLIDRMLVLNQIALDELTAAVQASTRTGARQAKWLIATASDHAAAESERFARRVLRDAGISGWVANFPIMLGGRERKVDLALRHLRIGIEVKGWMFHSAGDRGSADDQRVVEMQLSSWIVIPIAWLALHSDPDAFVHQVKAAIAYRIRQAQTPLTP